MPSSRTTRGDVNVKLDCLRGNYNKLMKREAASTFSVKRRENVKIGGIPSKSKRAG